MMNRRNFLRLAISAAAPTNAIPPVGLSDVALPAAGAPAISQLQKLVAVENLKSSQLMDCLDHVFNVGAFYGYLDFLPWMLVRNIAGSLNGSMEEREKDYLRRLTSPSTRPSLLEEIRNTVINLTPAEQREFAKHLTEKDFDDVKGDLSKQMCEEWLAGVVETCEFFDSWADVPERIAGPIGSSTRSIQARIGEWTRKILAGGIEEVPSDPIFSVLLEISRVNRREIECSDARYEELLAQAEHHGVPRHISVSSECYFGQWRDLTKELHDVEIELDHFLASSRRVVFPEFMINRLRELVDLCPREPAWRGGMQTRVTSIIEEFEALQLNNRRLGAYAYSTQVDSSS